MKKKWKVATDSWVQMMTALCDYFQVMHACCPMFGSSQQVKAENSQSFKFHSASQPSYLALGWVGLAPFVAMKVSPSYEYLRTQAVSLTLLPRDQSS